MSVSTSLDYTENIHKKDLRFDFSILNKSTRNNTFEHATDNSRRKDISCDPLDWNQSSCRQTRSGWDTHIWRPIYRRTAPSLSIHEFRHWPYCGIGTD